MRLLLDEDTQARRLVGLLRARGHDVLTVGEADGIGAPDSAVLIGFADDPGPIRLFHRTRDRSYRPLEPEEHHSKAMYRIHIPVTLRGGIRKGPQADEEDGLGLGDS